MEVSTMDYSALEGIVTAVTKQFSTANVLGMITGVIGATVAFVFMWWGARYIYRRITKAAKSGKARV